MSKEEVKLLLFTDGRILYVENPKDSTKKLLELIHEFSKLQDIKSMHRNQLHFYTPIMKQQKEKSRNQSHLQFAPKPIKYLGINQTKEVENLYSKNYRKLMKEIEEDTHTKNGKYSMLLGWKNEYC